MTATNILHQIETPLQAWAIWSQQHISNTIEEGYSNPFGDLNHVESVYHNYLSHQKNHHAAYTTEGPQMTSFSPEYVEASLFLLATLQSRLAQVIHIHYLGEGTLKEKAAYLGISSARYRTLLIEAKYWLAGRFSHFFWGKDTP